MGDIVAIIPARYASTRLPGKPLIDLAGKPMIQHVYERVRKARLVHRVIVATDDRRIFDVVVRFGGEAVMTSQEIRSGSDRAASVAKKLDQARIIVNIQGDEPLIEPAMIDETIQPLIDDPAIPAATLVRRTHSSEEYLSPNVVKAVLNTNGFVLYFSRAPIPYGLIAQTDHSNGVSSHEFFKHIGIYVFRKEVLMAFAGLAQTDLERTEKLEQLRLLQHGYAIRAVVTEHDSISVDTAGDVEKVISILESTPRAALEHPLGMERNAR